MNFRHDGVEPLDYPELAHESVAFFVGDGTKRLFCADQLGLGNRAHSFRDFVAHAGEQIAGCLFRAFPFLKVSAPDDIHVNGAERLSRYLA